MPDGMKQPWCDARGEIRCLDVPIVGEGDLAAYLESQVSGDVTGESLMWHWLWRH